MSAEQHIKLANPDERAWIIPVREGYLISTPGGRFIGLASETACTLAADLLDKLQGCNIEDSKDSVAVLNFDDDMVLADQLLTIKSEYVLFESGNSLVIYVDNDQRNYIHISRILAYSLALRIKRHKELLC